MGAGPLTGRRRRLRHLPGGPGGDTPATARIPVPDPLLAPPGDLLLPRLATTTCASGRPGPQYLVVTGL